MFIKGLHFSVMLVNNAEMSSEGKARAASVCDLVIERKNIGRDIGAYRDGFIYAKDSGYLHSAEYLLFANDSLAFIPGAFADITGEELQAAMNNDYDGIYTHINYAPSKHYQSFFVLLSRRVFNSSYNIDFWKSYVPLSDRDHSINKGEISWSSKVLNRYSRNSLVLYTPLRLKEAIRSMKLPPGVGSLPVLMPSVNNTVSKLGRSPSEQNYAYSFLFDDCIANEDFSDCSLTMKDLHISNLCELIENTNQTHSAAFLYPLFLGCPFIKMDLCTAGSFTISVAASNYRKLLSISLDQHPNSALYSVLFQEYYARLESKGIPGSFTSSRRKAALLGIGNGFIYPTCISGWK